MSLNQTALNEPSNPSALLQPEAPSLTPTQRFIQQSKNAWQQFTAFFSVAVMGIPARLWWEGFAETSVASKVVFDGIAVVVASVAVALAAMVNASQLLSFSWYSAFFMAIWVGFGLYMLDRHNIRMRYEGASNWRFRLLFSLSRAVVLMVMFSLALFSAVNAQREAIDAAIENQLAEGAKALADNPRFKPQLDAARESVELASKVQKRRAEIQTEISKKADQRESALQDYRDECEGNTSADGRTRRRRCGPLARGAESSAIALGNQVAALSRELKEIGSPDLAKATADLDRIEAKIAEEAKKTVGGLPNRVKTLFHLLETDWSAKASVIPWLIISLIPEGLIWVAFARPVDPVITKLAQLEGQLASGYVDAYRRNERDRLGLRNQPLIVHVPAASPPRPVPLKAVAT